MESKPVVNVFDPAASAGNNGVGASAVPERDIALRVEGVSKRFKKEVPSLWQRMRHRKAGSQTVVALSDVSLQVRRGEIYGVLGPNGSGKSTLVRVISTLMIPDAGRVTVFGRDVSREEMTVKRMINRVSVDAAFFKKLSPMENLMYGARLYGVSSAEAAPKAREILNRLGVRESSLYEPMEEMSRGMQQKVAIARAFLTQPILLLLDEPTTGLDPRSKREVQAVVEELRDTHDATILLTTHDMNEADALCDYIAILDDGRIVAQDTPAGLKAMISRNGHEPTLEDVFMDRSYAVDSKVSHG